jgi:predicted dehydrogenase
MGCAIFADYRGMLDEFAGKIDVCFIPTGIGMHAPMAIAAMNAGANCLIEKPAAPTVQDVAAMKEAEKRNGKFTAVGFQSVYLPEILNLKKKILAGGIGRLKQVKVVGFWPRDSAYYARNGWAGKMRDANGGWVLDSPYNNALAHYLNLACFLAGDSLSESAGLKSVQAALFRCNPEIENADSACIRLETSNDVEILFYVTHCSETSLGPVIKLIGGRGSVETDMNTINIKTADGADETIEIDNSRLRVNLMDAVLKRVSNPSEFICGLDIAGTHTLAVNGAHESSPILVADPDDVERRELDNGAYRFICRGLDDFLKRLFDNGAMPDSTPYAWLSVGEEFKLEGYREFNL